MFKFDHLQVCPSEKIYKGTIVCHQIPLIRRSVPAKRDVEQRNKRDVIQGGFEDLSSRAPGVIHIDFADTVGPASIAIDFLIDEPFGYGTKTNFRDT